MKLVQNVCLNEISDKIEKESCVVKTTSRVPILQKSCQRSRGCLFCPVLMKLGQNVCPNEILDEFENESFGVKK